jgi:hypothetical protein
MPGKRFWRWVVVLAAMTPMGCQAICDRWAPCHDRPLAAYPSYPGGAYAPTACCPPPCNPCCVPAGYTAPTNAYQQGSWAAPQVVPQTRLSPNPCE